MKNKLTFLFVIAAMTAMVLGCGGLNPFGDGSSSSSPSNSSSSNKTLTDKGVDTVVGESKIGVPECDAVMDVINAEMNNPDDNFVTKAVKQTILNRIKDQIREAVEKDNNSKEEMAKTCKEMKVQLQKSLEEQKAKE